MSWAVRAGRGQQALSPDGARLPVAHPEERAPRRGAAPRPSPATRRSPRSTDVSFEVARGEAFGIVGGNGSGKSTLLKLIAGILKPTTGSLETAGRVAALIELGAGFHPEISGRENIFINGAVLGLSKREIAARYERIVEFSGLEDFIEEPVKNYSSGMYVRLGFAVAIHTDPDILLVDEVLAVGDEAFAHRCLRRIEELLASGRTVIFVSHSLGLVEELCSRVLWLDDGRVRLIGEPRRVVDAYRQEVAEEESREHREAKEEREREEEGAHAAVVAAEESGEVLRWGSGAAEILGVRLLDARRRALPLRERRGGDLRARGRGRASRSPTSSSASACSRRAASRSGAPTPTSTASRAQRFSGRAKVRPRVPLPAPGARRVPGRRRRPRAGRRALRLSPQAPRFLGHQRRGRRRGLPPRAPLAFR